MAGNAGAPAYGGPQLISGTTALFTPFGNTRGIRCDANGRLEVVAAPGVGLNVNIFQVGGNATVTAGVNGLLAVGGNVADDAVDAGYPVKVGGRADAVLSLVADGDRVDFVTDLYRRLWVVIAGYDSGSNANRTFEVAPLNLQVLEESLLDVTNHAASAGVSYPSNDGLVMMGYKDLSLTGKFICGAGNTVAMTVEGTNDEDATPANRDWIVLYAYRTDTNTVVNGVACGAGATLTYAWDFDECNYRYVRVRLVVVDGGAASNTIIIKIRRKAL
jgi:hypothetical protein